MSGKVEKLDHNPDWRVVMANYVCIVRIVIGSVTDLFRSNFAQLMSNSSQLMWNIQGLPF